MSMTSLKEKFLLILDQPKAGMAPVKTFWIIGLATDINPIPPLQTFLLVPIFSNMNVKK